MEAKIKMKQIDAALLQKMLIGGAKRLEANKEYINELNVFPVPDGDTGTNMTMTALAAAKEVGNAAEVTVKEVTRGLSSGSLRGARGNSGVILSQLFRGFYKGVKDQDVLTTETVAVGFKKAVETAYKAVMKPKEGTILTVAKVTAEKAVYCARNTEDFEEFAQVVIKEANEILQKTPEMLPVLKEAGVVDSGGQGLVEFLQGAVDALMGKEVDLSSVEKTAVKPAATASEAPLEEKDIKFGYCTEFIVMTKEEISMEEEQKFKDFLMGIGDSIVVVADEDIIKDRKIAGTGTISYDGTVGEIDGIKYKIMGAAKDNAKIVFVPTANYEEAIMTKNKYKYDLEIVRVDNFKEAIEYLKK